MTRRSKCSSGRSRRRPDSPEALNFYGVALKSVGRLDEAREHILKALKLNDAMYGAYANLNDLVDFSEGVGEELFNRMEAIFESVANTEADPFSRCISLMRRRSTTAASTRRRSSITSSAGKMKRAQLDYKEAETFGFFDGIRAAFPKEVFENRKFEGLDDDRPVFIVGMPRSGSTLVEQILSSHPDVYGAGEVKYLSRALGQLRDRFPVAAEISGHDGEAHSGAARNRRQELSVRRSPTAQAMPSALPTSC